MLTAGRDPEAAWPRSPCWPRWANGSSALLAGAKRDQNLFYQLLQVLTRPLIAGARSITPTVVLDRHVPLVAFLLLVFVWLVGHHRPRSTSACSIGVHLCK